MTPPRTPIANVLASQKVAKEHPAASTSQGLGAGMWRTIGNVLIASMNKGLFVPACVFFLVLVMLLKTPKEYFPTLWGALADYHQWGYIMTLIAVTGWGVNVRYLRRIHHNEMARISSEKKLLQEERAGRLMKTTEHQS